MGGCWPLMSGVEIWNWVWNQPIKSFVMFEMSSNESRWWAALKVSLSASSPLGFYSQRVSAEEIRLWIASSSKSLVRCRHRAPDGGCSGFGLLRLWRENVWLLPLQLKVCQTGPVPARLSGMPLEDSQIKCQIRAFKFLATSRNWLKTLIFFIL